MTQWFNLCRSQHSAEVNISCQLLGLCCYDIMSVFVQVLFTVKAVLCNVWLVVFRLPYGITCDVACIAGCMTGGNLFSRPSVVRFWSVHCIVLVKYVVKSFPSSLHSLFEGTQVTCMLLCGLLYALSSNVLHICEWVIRFVWACDLHWPLGAGLQLINSQLTVTLL